MDIIEQDVSWICDSVETDFFAGKSILISGGTGLIGRTLVPTLLKIGANVTLIVRSIEKAQKLFGASCSFIVGTVENLPSIDGQIDYVIHMASPTSSQFFVSNPVETFEIAVNGTRNLLELSKNSHVKGFLYLSSMEVYGYPEKGHHIAENEVSGFDTRMPRNSYPLSKLCCEAMCCAYASEYDVPAKIIRLTQTFGPGVEYGDKRIFAEFMRCIIEKKNIVLHTKGETERCYLYTADAVSAMLTVLSKGNNGQVYNAANTDTYCSIREMAELAANIGDIKVEYEIDSAGRGYADTLYSYLNVNNLTSLGWKPQVCLKEIFERMIVSRNESFYYE